MSSSDLSMRPQGTDPQSPKFRYKLEWFERLYDFFDGRFSPGAPLVWELSPSRDAAEIRSALARWKNELPNRS